MFLTVHSSLGILASQTTSVPFLSFLYGFISHFILDIIPHGDFGFNLWFKKFSKKQQLRIMFLLAAVDTLGVLVLIFASLHFLNLPQPLNLVWGVLGSVLPDFLWGLSEILPSRLLKKFYQLHYRLHHLLPEKLSFKKGALIQVISLLVFSILAINYFI